VLAGSLARQGLRASPLAPPPVSNDEPVDPPHACAVQRWAASGAMALTGRPDGTPQWPVGDVIERLEAAARMISVFSREMGAEVTVDVGGVLTDRAAARGWSAGGSTSAGGRCRLLAASDGWVALSLARQSDLELVGALVSARVDAVAGVGVPASPAGAVEPEAWEQAARHARRTEATAFTARAQLLGLPAGNLPRRRPRPGAPWSVTVLGAPSHHRPSPPVVVDFSALWAGPLCAHLLGQAGARVVKVEDRVRPDAARWGDPVLFERLHRGHQSVTVDLGTPEGRATVHRLVDRADVVIEASRPRALHALGLSPVGFCAARPGRTWVSITGYGRTGPRSNWVAFGDDAAAAGGLVAHPTGEEPVFCADAIADPASGLYAATAALASISQGGGHLVDCSMVTAAAYANADDGCRRVHLVERSPSGWTVSHEDLSSPVPVALPGRPWRRAPVGDRRR
jgi:hypothetical protein